MKKNVTALLLLILVSCASKENMQSKIAIISSYGHKDTVTINYYNRLYLEEDRF